VFIPPTGLDRELLAEFEAESRQGYAELLAALTRAAHPDAGVAPYSDEWAAVARLCESWLTALALAAPRAEVRSRFPLNGARRVQLLDTLLALAVYSGSPAERAERVGSALHELGRAVDASP
jgi:hypothetical protein